MNYRQLTEKQQNVLGIIISHIRSYGFPPSIREIQERSGIASLRGVTLQLDGLEDAGYISRKKGARQITINPSLLEDNEERIRIPLMTCVIHAGSPTEADEHSDEFFSVSLTQTKGLRNVFAVKVIGESMINAGIQDGDIAIIHPQPVAHDGDIVAAIIHNSRCNGVTLKKYRIVEGRPMLFPANPDPRYKPILDAFEIQGRLINVITP